MIRNTPLGLLLNNELNTLSNPIGLRVLINLRPHWINVYDVGSIIGLNRIYVGFNLIVTYIGLVLYTAWHCVLYETFVYKFVRVLPLITKPHTYKLTLIIHHSIDNLTKQALTRSLYKVVYKWTNINLCKTWCLSLVLRTTYNTR
jgi:hypothetical protein